MVICTPTAIRAHDDAPVPCSAGSSLAAPLQAEDAVCSAAWSM
jgi:hypothetical protein